MEHFGELKAQSIFPLVAARLQFFIGAIVVWLMVFKGKQSRNRTSENPTQLSVISVFPFFFLFWIKLLILFQIFGCKKSKKVDFVHLQQCSCFYAVGFQKCFLFILYAILSLALYYWKIKTNISLFISCVVPNIFLFFLTTFGPLCWINIVTSLIKFQWCSESIYISTVTAMITLVSYFFHYSLDSYQPTLPFL